MAEDTDKGDHSALVLILKEDRFPITAVKEIDVIEEKASHLPEE